MSEARMSFDYGIQDAEDLLSHFDSINSKPPPANAEALKRAGLVMALTAWETYVEDRVSEGLKRRLSALTGSFSGDFIQKRFMTDLKQFHNPSAEKTKYLFSEYLGVDVTQGWHWANVEPVRAKTLLNQWISKRGDAVHRSKPINNGASVQHLINRDELLKAIRFLKDLVSATELHLDNNL